MGGLNRPERRWRRSGLRLRVGSNPQEVCGVILLGLCSDLPLGLLWSLGLAWLWCQLTQA